jgi:hypothetical protein
MSTQIEQRVLWRLRGQRVRTDPETQRSLLAVPWQVTTMDEVLPSSTPR